MRLQQDSGNTRCNPTTALTKTTHQELAPPPRAAPTPAKNLLGLRGAGMDDVDVWAKDLRQQRMASRNSSQILASQNNARETSFLGDSSTLMKHPKQVERNQSNLLKWEIEHGSDAQKDAAPPLQVRNQENNYSVFSARDDPAASASLKSPRACTQAGDGTGPTLLAGGAKGTTAPRALGLRKESANQAIEAMMQEECGYRTREAIADRSRAARGFRWF
ncbi:unnamed protein product [Symbiodinium sp. CCMP2456]|nr:unnamed protein product [Symbiodinium sp. CCMP2456]